MEARVPWLIWIMIIQAGKQAIKAEKAEKWLSLVPNRGAELSLSNHIKAKCAVYARASQHLFVCLFVYFTSGEDFLERFLSAPCVGTRRNCQVPNLSEQRERQLRAKIISVRDIITHVGCFLSELMARHTDVLHQPWPLFQGRTVSDAPRHVQIEPSKKQLNVSRHPDQPQKFQSIIWGRIQI